MKNKYWLSIFALSSLILPTLQTIAKGPQNPLQDPQPVDFVENVLSDNQAYCSVSNPISTTCLKKNI